MTTITETIGHKPPLARSLCVLLLACCVIAPTSVDAATFYVSTSGSDSNPGTQAAPWRTLGKAAATMVAGDTTFVQDGTYVEGAVNFLTSGTASQPITLKAQNRRQAILSSTSGCFPNISVSASFISIEGLRITLDPSSNVSNCSPPHPNASSGTGIYCWWGSLPSPSNPSTGNRNCTIRDVEVSGHAQHTRSEGIKVTQDFSLIENNDVYAGIEPMHGFGIIVRNNFIGGCDAWGSCFIAKGGLRSYQAYDNILHMPVGQPWPMGLALGASSGNQFLFDPPSGIEAYNAVAYNNVIIDDSPSCCPAIALGMWGCSNCALYNNVLINGGLFLLPSSHGAATTNPVIKNNIVDCGGKAAFSNNQSSGLTLNYNNFFNCTSVPSQTNPTTGNPLFVNRLSDWHLQAGSPGIGAGTLATFTGSNGEAISVNKDKDSVVRTVPWDLGIYSFRNGQGADSTPPISPSNLLVQ